MSKPLRRKKDAGIEVLEDKDLRKRTRSEVEIGEDESLSGATTSKKLNKKSKKAAVVDTVSASSSMDSDDVNGESNDVDEVVVVPKRKFGKGQKAKANKIATAEAAAKAKKQLVLSTPADIIYLGHIPHGFYELEMKKFFNQFGKVKRSKLYRSQKTGNSKGYAFIQFEDASTATVVAEAMQGYMISEKQLVCHVVPPEKIHDGMFRMRSKRKTMKRKAKDSLKRQNKGNTEIEELHEEDYDVDDDDDNDTEKDIENKNDMFSAMMNRKASEKTAKQLKSQRKSIHMKQKSLEALGINFDFIDAMKK